MAGELAPQDDLRSRAASPVVGLLTCFAAALLVHLPLLREPAWPGVTAAAEGGTLPWGLEPLLAAAPDATCGIVAWRVLVCLLLAGCGASVTRIAAAAGARAWTALAAGLIVAGSGAGAAGLLDPAGIGWVLATLAWLASAALRSARPSEHVVPALLVLVAALASNYAFLPLIPLAWVVRPAGGARQVFSRLLASVLIGAVLTLAGAVREFHVGYGVAVDSTWSVVDGSDAAWTRALDAATSALGRVLGVLGTSPFLAGQAEFAWIGLAALVALAALAIRARRAALPVGATLAILLAIGTIATNRSVSATPAAALRPGTAALARALAAASRLRSAEGMLARFLLSIAPPATLIASALGHGEAPALSHLRSALPSPYAAALIAQRADAVEAAAALRRACLEGETAVPRTPLALEARLGMQLLERLETAGDEAGALAWLEEWIAAQERGSPPRFVAVAHARRLALVLRSRGVEAMAALLDAEQESFGSEREWVAEVASVLVDALHRAADDPAFVAAIAPRVERLLAAASARPEAAAAEELLCLAHLRAGQMRRIEAVRLAETAIARDPGSARPHLVLARLYLAAGEPAAGLAAVARARQLDPDDRAALLLEGRILAASPDFAEKGARRLLEAFAAAPGLPGAREEVDGGCFEAVEGLLARGLPERAREIVADALAAIGRRPGLLHAVARIAVHERRIEAALEPLEECIALAPGRADAREELCEALRTAGYSRLIAGERERALSWFRRAIEIAPPGFDVAGMQAVVESSEEPREPPAAERIAAARTAFEDGVRLYSADQKEGAAAAFRRSIGLLPANPLAHSHLGRIELELGRAGDAERTLRTAIALSDEVRIDVEEAWLHLVRALQAQEGREAEVAQVAREYLSRHPEGRFRELLAPLRGGE